ncbi:phage/plasmid primase [Gemella morbillorum M424]|uniref:DNA primase n=2 Tax=Gemella morbillorum TaxID=29391 RepID=A0AAP9KTT8_9BACL|nr:phage/plasmid primase [Gemella morbillorum M424]QGS09914.1 DNA primase [Gemella morbillorum]
MLVNTPVFEVEEYQYTEEYKLSKAYYFISGEFTEATNGEYHRNNGGLLSRDLICIDIEDTKMEVTEVLNTIQESLKEYKYVLYSTFKHEESNPRLRLVLEPSRDIVKDEYKPTIQHVMALVGVNYDTKCETWSQLSGLPIVKKGNEHIFIKHLDGLPYPVQEAAKEEKKVKVEYTASDVRLSDEDFKEMFIRYLELDNENLNPGDSEEYNRALSVLLSLARDVCYKDISYDVACECSDLLANIGANPDKYREDNLNKINHAIKSWQSNSNYFENEKSYSMLQRFEIVGNKKDKNFAYLVRCKLNKPISNTSELHWRLFTIGEQWRKENTIVNKKTGKKIISQMPFYIIAKFLQENIPIKKGGIHEDTALLFFYDFSKGIYTSNEDYIKTCIKKLEIRYKLTKLKDITEDLRANTKFEKPYRPEHLIAVGNGLFNTKTKLLESFNPKYFITAKVDTNYNINALKNYEAIKDIYFNYDNWLNSIACGDPEIIALFWQLTNEAINPNKTRRKIAIMLGSGTNGKSTFRQMIINLIGDTNISVATPHELQSRFGLTSLEGKICNYGDEVGTKPLDEMDKLKSISSGESVNYELKNKDVRNYDFKTLLIFNSNEIPLIKDKSEAVLNRLLIIPFKANFEGVKDESIKDEKLKDKRILEYILYTALNLEFDKFIVPKAVQQQLEVYKQENDSIYNFMLSYIDEGYHRVSCVPISFITNDYENYCYENGYNPRKRIGKQLEIHLNNRFKGDIYQYEVKNHRFTKENTVELRRFGKNTEILENNVKSALKRVENR